MSPPFHGHDSADDFQSLEKPLVIRRLKRYWFVKQGFGLRVLQHSVAKWKLMTPGQAP
ncbi:hypothetical protein AWB68_02737 [Caballeronia choica]|uniref:Uncharacterized protein n=1 Tax=Caballeronia choica TaxID=326476 RepID=A0A158IJ77_9BURK|nr:hypothetical protein AWB68_02737 [Caballeronia choica]